LTILTVINWKRIPQIFQKLLTIFLLVAVLILAIIFYKKLKKFQFEVCLFFEFLLIGLNIYLNIDKSIHNGHIFFLLWTIFSFPLSVYSQVVLVPFFNIATLGAFLFYNFDDICYKFVSSHPYYAAGILSLSILILLIILKNVKEFMLVLGFEVWLYILYYLESLFLPKWSFKGYLTTMFYLFLILVFTSSLETPYLFELTIFFLTIRTLVLFFSNLYKKVSFAILFILAGAFILGLIWFFIHFKISVVDMKLFIQSFLSGFIDYLTAI
jgi:hypothetical protein